MLCIYTCLKWKVRPVISLSNRNASGTYKYKNRTKSPEQTGDTKKGKK